MQTTITITQKMSGTGSIHDLASEHFDIEIGMGQAYQFVVILPSYFRAPLTHHRTAKAALRALDKLSREGFGDVAVILDRTGEEINRHRLWSL